MKAKFKVGDRVELVTEHRSWGGVYKGEADLGSIAVIERVTREAINNGGVANYGVNWVINTHPDRENGNGSCVDEDCLEFEHVVTDEDMAEVYRILGVEQ